MQYIIFLYFRLLYLIILNENTKQDNLYTIAFYNLENLFDIYDDPDTMDDDFTPEGKKKWNVKRYNRKLKKLSSVISQIGTNFSFTAPVIVGLAEVENLQVVTDLVNRKELQAYNYGIAHFDSPDERGIDVALIYQKEHFEFIDSEAITLYLYQENGDRDYTRDVLLVKGNLNGELIYFIVNHWPSRRKGTNETEHRRIKAATLNNVIISQIKSQTENPKIIILGDFNDNPTSKSIKHYLVTDDFHNPFESIYDKGRGTSIHDNNWYLFDQIIFSRNLFDSKPNSHIFKYAEIFDEHFLKQWKGKRKGNPFRTYIGKWHQGGFSDHFPVFIGLEKN